MILDVLANLSKTENKKLSFTKQFRYFIELQLWVFIDLTLSSWQIISNSVLLNGKHLWTVISWSLHCIIMAMGYGSVNHHPFSCHVHTRVGFSLGDLSVFGYSHPFPKFSLSLLVEKPERDATTMPPVLNMWWAAPDVCQIKCLEFSSKNLIFIQSDLKIFVLMSFK